MIHQAMIDLALLVSRTEQTTAYRDNLIRLMVEELLLSDNRCRSLELLCHPGVAG